jgi:hypothetical protein
MREVRFNSASKRDRVVTFLVDDGGGVKDFLISFVNPASSLDTQSPAKSPSI